MTNGKRIQGASVSLVIYLAAAAAFLGLDPGDAALLARTQARVPGTAIGIVEGALAEIGGKAVAVLVIDGVALVPEIPAAGGRRRGNETGEAGNKAGSGDHQGWFHLSLLCIGGKRRRLPIGIRMAAARIDASQRICLSSIVLRFLPAAPASYAVRSSGAGLTGPCALGGPAAGVPSWAKHERQPMSDIGSIFSTWDIIAMILVACAPGFVIGAALGAWRNPGRRLKGATVFGLTGFALAFAGWWLYLTVIK